MTEFTGTFRMAGELLQKSKAFPCHEFSRHTHVLLTFMVSRWHSKLAMTWMENGQGKVAKGSQSSWCQEVSYGPGAMKKSLHNQELRSYLSYPQLSYHILALIFSFKQDSVWLTDLQWGDPVFNCLVNNDSDKIEAQTCHKSTWIQLNIFFDWSDLKYAKTNKKLQSLAIHLKQKTHMFFCTI